MKKGKTMLFCLLLVLTLLCIPLFVNATVGGGTVLEQSDHQVTGESSTVKALHNETQEYSRPELTNTSY